MLKEKYQKAYKEYQEDALITIHELGVKYGFARSSFFRALKKENIPVPKKRIRILADRTKLQKAQELYLMGYSIAQISVKLHMGELTISKYLKFKGIELRDKRSRIPDKNLNHNYFSEIKTEEKAYWLGFLFADGSVEKTHYNAVSLELAEIDQNHLVKFRKTVNSINPIKKRRNRETYMFRVNSSIMVNDLCSYGCVPNKTDNGYIELSKIPKQFYRDFLRGYFDGDGYIDKKRYRIIYTVKLHRIVSTIVDMLATLGILTKVYSEKNYFRIIIETKDNFFKCLNTLYDEANVYLDRKYIIYKQRITTSPPD